MIGRSSGWYSSLMFLHSNMQSTISSCWIVVNTFWYSPYFLRDFQSQNVSVEYFYLRLWSNFLATQSYSKLRSTGQFMWKYGMHCQPNFLQSRKEHLYLPHRLSHLVSFFSNLSTKVSGSLISLLYLVEVFHLSYPTHLLKRFDRLRVRPPICKFGFWDFRTTFPICSSPC